MGWVGDHVRMAVRSVHHCGVKMVWESESSAVVCGGVVIEAVGLSEMVQACERIHERWSSRGDAYLLRYFCELRIGDNDMGGERGRCLDL